MKRAETLLVSILIAVSALGATAHTAAAYTADAWVNSDSFTRTCLGFDDSYPSQLYDWARFGMSQLGYSPLAGTIGSGFTRSAFLNHVLYPWAVYVHSHADNYWTSSGTNSGILQDPGTGNCSNYSRDMISSSQIKSATLGSFYNLVVMSACNIGSSSSTMPWAFQMDKTKSSSQRKFYLGYDYLTYDSSELRFESNFWSYLNGGYNHSRTVGQAFNYAVSIGGYESVNSSNPFSPDWWGNPNYNGTPG